MTLLVDTNILLDVLEDDPQWAEWSIFQLRAQSQIHQLAINPIIYAELSLAFSTVEKLDYTIMSLDLYVLEIPRAALFLAGKAFLQYRRRGGTKRICLQTSLLVLMPLLRGIRCLQGTRDDIEIISRH